MLKLWFDHLLHIFFPKLCAACDAALLANEEILCTSCLYHLPLTDFHEDLNNETTRQLWGKVDFVQAMSMFHMAKSSRVEVLLHRLKYKNQPEIGVFLGKWYAKIIRHKLSSIDVIVPIPIHYNKLHRRGYNQAGQFAEGLSEGLNIPLSADILIRTVNSVSQTKKARIDRYDNVSGVFQVIKSSELEGKHILLVDDVLTTGATITEAGNLLNSEGARISIVTIARA